MQIQINTPGETLPDAFLEQIETSLHDVLRPHEAHLTRVEVHLRDQNGNKGGIDKRCLIEARPRGMQPLVAEDESTGHAEAFKGALGKLKSVLAHRLGKLGSH